MRSHLWDSHLQRALSLPSFSWSPQETRNSQPVRMCPPGDHTPLPARILRPRGPRTPNSLRPASWAYVDLFPHPSSRDTDLLGGSGAAVQVCVRILDVEAGVVSAAPHSEQEQRLGREVRWGRLFSHHHVSSRDFRSLGVLSSDLPTRSLWRYAVKAGGQGHLVSQCVPSIYMF